MESKKLPGDTIQVHNELQPMHVFENLTSKASFRVIGAAAAILGPSNLAQASLVPARAQSAQTVSFF